MVKINKWAKRAALFGIAAYFAFGLGVNCYFRKTFPEVDQSVSVVKRVNEEIKNHKPKRILYLASSDFSIKYSDSYDDVKTKLEGSLNSFGYHFSFGEVEKLRKEISEMNVLNEADFDNAFSALNLFQTENIFAIEERVPYLVRAPVKEAKIDLAQFKDEESFFNALTNEGVKSLDEIIIFAHGLSYQIMGNKNDLSDESNEKNNISIRDIISLPEDKVQKIRSKLNPGAVIYLLSCETLQNYENKTTIAEVFAYLFQRPVVASVSDIAGWPVYINVQTNCAEQDVHTEGMTLNDSLQRILLNCKLKYENNGCYGDWRVVQPK